MSDTPVNEVLTGEWCCSTFEEAELLRSIRSQGRPKSSWWMRQARLGWEKEQERLSQLSNVSSSATAEQRKEHANE